MDRREFLHPRQLLSVAGPVIGIADELAPTDALSSSAVMLRFVRRAMATTFEVIVPFGTLAETAERALDEIDRLEAQLTVYRDSSEVSRLNAMAFHRPVRIEARLFTLLSLAERLHRETEGAFDVSIGALIKSWGFFRRAGRVPSIEEREAVRAHIGMRHVVLDAQRLTVAYQRQGLEINLGSIGKGYALDQAAALVEQAAPNLLMHGGHSSVLARGSETPSKSGWTIGLCDPLCPGRRRALLQLCNRAMATSAATFQHIEHEGRKLGHLLDPRTAWPAGGMLSATVTASTAAEADALATAFFILGVDKARAYCAMHPDIGAALIAADLPQRLVLLGRATQEVHVLS